MFLLSLSSCDILQRCSYVRNLEYSALCSSCLESTYAFTYSKTSLRSQVFSFSPLYLSFHFHSAHPLHHR